MEKKLPKYHLSVIKLLKELNQRLECGKGHMMPYASIVNTLPIGVLLAYPNHFKPRNLG